MKLPYSSNGYIIDLSWVKEKARNVIVQAMLEKAQNIGLSIKCSDTKYLINASYIWLCKTGNISWTNSYDTYLILIRSNCKEVSVNNFLNCEGIEKYLSESSAVFDLRKTSTFILDGKEYEKVAMSYAHVIGDEKISVNLVLVDKTNERHS